MNSSTFTVDDLARILVEGAGAPDGSASGRDITDLEFAVLGYDSLALLETSGRIEREYAVALDESWLMQARTPRELIRYVNEAIAVN